MDILLVSGFLGSGKTTVIAKLTDHLTARGRRVCVIENEAGAFGVDDLVLGDGPIRVTSLLGGCVCCQLTGQLIDALRTIRDQYAPDQVIVELSGVAAPAALPESIPQYVGEDCTVTVLTVVDAARWRVLSHVAAPLMESQLRDSRVQLVTRLAQAKDGDAACNDIKALCAAPELYPFSPEDPLPAGLLRTLFGEEAPA